MRIMTLAALTMLACAGDPRPPGDATSGDADGALDTGHASQIVETQAVAAATRADLRMKRWRQLALDLQGALALAPDQVCRETGLYDCTTLHVIPLGGVSIDNGLYDPIDHVAVTTGLAIERMALQACWNRLELDRAADAPPVVFDSVDLHADSLDPGAAETQTRDLYRRFLARDPSPAETTAAIALHGDVAAEGGANAEWALMLCFALSTSTEALLY